MNKPRDDAMEHQAGEGDEVHARHGRGQALVVARQGGRSLGSIRQGVPVRTIQRYPLNNSRKG